MRYIVGLVGLLFLLPSFVFAQVEGNLVTLFANQRVDTKTKSSFLKAVKDGNVPLVKKYLNQNEALANVSDKEGNTALMYAAQKGDLSLIKLLNGKGAKVNTVNNEGNSALCLALLSLPKVVSSPVYPEYFEWDEAKVLPTVNLLMSLNAHVNVSCSAQIFTGGPFYMTKFSPLHYAVARPMPRVVDALIKYQANVNSAITLYYSHVPDEIIKASPIDMFGYPDKRKSGAPASPETYAQTVSSLLGANAKFKDLRKPEKLLKLCMRSDSNYEGVLDVLLTRKIIPGNINSYKFYHGSTLTESVCYGASLPVIKVLVKHGAKVTDEKEINTMLRCATEGAEDNNRLSETRQHYQKVLAYLTQLGYK